MDKIIYIIIGAVIAVLGIAAAIIFYVIGKKKFEEKFKKEFVEDYEKEVGSASERAKQIVDEGIKEAETQRKEALLEAKEQILQQKNETERELKERRNEVARTERRLAAKEESLDRKTENIERKEETLNKKIRENEELGAKIEELRSQEVVRLEEIAGLSAEEAKNQLVAGMEEEIRHETAMKIVEIESQLKEDADQKAREIIALAIQRCASDQVSETTVSVVPLPNDDMKGRIIGREGRNIRTIETLTGVELIIDDTPEAITISGFDPIRREIARLALEKLITDGRIHPTRIEETVEKARKDVDTMIKQAGERATFEVGIHGINNDLVRMLGRLRFRTSYGQNVLQHSIEVAHVSGIIADELGVDSTLAKRAGLLHDIGKAMTQEVEGSHVQLGVDIAKKFKESRDVIHAIEAHHNDVEPQTIIAMIVQAADAVSAARPGARREDLENYLKRLQKLEEIANSFPGIDKSYAIQAGREIRVMVKPEEVNDDQMIITAREIVKKIESSMEYPGQIKISLIRESRAVDYAK